MPLPIEYTSFLIRLWREANPDPRAPPAEWQGEAEHIQTGQCWAFGTLDELLGFLRKEIEDPQASNFAAALMAIAEEETP